MIDPDTGDADVIGRFVQQAQGRVALRKDDALYISQDARGNALQNIAPEAYHELIAAGALMQKTAKKCKLNSR